MEQQITLTVEQCRLLLEWSKVNKEADLGNQSTTPTPTQLRIAKDWASIIKKLKRGTYGPKKALAND